jgi:hypothetical protein
MQREAKLPSLDETNSSVNAIDIFPVKENKCDESTLNQNQAIESVSSDPTIDINVDEKFTTPPPDRSKVVTVEGIDRLYKYLVGSWTAHNPFCETIPLFLLYLILHSSTPSRGNTT